MLFGVMCSIINARYNFSSFVCIKITFKNLKPEAYYVNFATRHRGYLGLEQCNYSIRNNSFIQNYIRLYNVLSVNVKNLIVCKFKKERKKCLLI